MTNQQTNDDDDDDDIANAKEVRGRGSRPRMNPVVVAANRYATSTDPEQRETMGRILGNLVKEPVTQSTKAENVKRQGASPAGGDSFGKELLVALGFTARDEPEHGSCSRSATRPRTSPRWYPRWSSRCVG